MIDAKAVVDTRFHPFNSRVIFTTLARMYVYHPEAVDQVP